ncbi:MAG: hypothetical protein K0U45_07300 [Alphaproteobacteria bacterium]|nr:hypothetical protein [Alphaproteobacteria bacterium]
MMNKILRYIMVCLLLGLLLAGCTEKRAIKKARLQAQCPEIFVLNHTDSLEVKAPGFERTNSVLYRLSFAQVSDECIVKEEKTRIHFNLVLKMEADTETSVIYPPFAVFVSFLDDDKKPLFREKITYRPGDWKKLDKLHIKNKITIDYPTDITPPAYVYLGFVPDKETLRKNYQ